MRGRPPNPNREAARAAGEKFYDAVSPCRVCDTLKRYVINCACVQCVVAKGSERYAALGQRAKAKLAKKDHERYMLRKQMSVSADTAQMSASDDITADAIPDDAFTLDSTNDEN